MKFWFRFVANNPTLIMTRQEALSEWKATVEPCFADFSAESFEQVCRQYLTQLRFSGKLPFSGRLWGDGGETARRLIWLEPITKDGIVLWLNASIAIRKSGSKCCAPFRPNANNCRLRRMPYFTIGFFLAWDLTMCCLIWLHGILICIWSGWISCWIEGSESVAKQ